MPVSQSGMYAEALEQQLWLLSRTAELGKRIEQAHTNPFLKAIENQLLLKALSEGEPYYWTRTTCDLLQAGAYSIPSWSLSPDDIPSESGFCWFEVPIQLDTMQLKALSWATCYTESPRQEGVGVTGWRVLPTRELVPLVARFWLFGQTLTHAVLREEAKNAVVDELYTSGELAAAGWSSDKEHPLTSIGRADTLLVMAAAVAFLDQRIAVATQQGIDRAARHRLMRSHPAVNPVVRVVELRRKVTVESAERAGHVQSDWTCQWIVRGHWRQQWYPRKQANQPIWIDPYVKGPDDKPLRPPRATVFAVIR